MSDLKEIQQDLQELEELMRTVQRERLKELLQVEICKCKLLLTSHKKSSCIESGIRLQSTEKEQKNNSKNNLNGRGANKNEPNPSNTYRIYKSSKEPPSVESMLNSAKQFEDSALSMGMTVSNLQIGFPNSTYVTPNLAGKLPTSQKPSYSTSTNGCPAGPQHPTTVELKIASWTQTLRFVNFVVKVPGITETSDFEVKTICNDSLLVTIKQVLGKNYILEVVNMPYEFNDIGGTHYVSKDELMVTLPKRVPRQHWLAINTWDLLHLQERASLAGHSNDKQPYVACKAAGGQSKGGASSKCYSDAEHQQPEHCWTVADTETVRTVLTGLELSGSVEPLGSVQVCVSPRNSDCPHTTNLIRKLAQSPGAVFRVQYHDTFYLQVQDSYDRDSKRLGLLTKNNRGIITGFYGHLRKCDLERLPFHIEVLGLGVKTPLDYEVALGLKPWPCLERVSLNFWRGLTPQQLTPLPAGYPRVCLHFYGMRDRNGEWMTSIINRVVAIDGHSSREFSIWIAASQMTAAAVRILSRRLRSHNVTSLTLESDKVSFKDKPLLKELYSKASIDLYFKEDYVTTQNFVPQL